VKVLAAVRVCPAATVPVGLAVETELGAASAVYVTLMDPAELVEIVVFVTALSPVVKFPPR
jgi:hypothetical protein